MAEYIEREALLSELQEEIEIETSMYTEEQNKYFNMGLKCAIRDVKSQPTADVVEVKHGEWITPTKIKSMNIAVPHCSLCGNVPCDKAFYCPYCGAKMDLKEGAESDL